MDSKKKSFSLIYLRIRTALTAIADVGGVIVSAESGDSNSIWMANYLSLRQEENLSSNKSLYSIGVKTSKQKPRIEKLSLKFVVQNKNQEIYEPKRKRIRRDNSENHIEIVRANHLLVHQLDVCAGFNLIM